MVSMVTPSWCVEVESPLDRERLSARTRWRSYRSRLLLAVGLAAAAGPMPAQASIVAWGGNTDGQCDVPAPNSGFVAVAGGGFHSLGLESGGSIGDSERCGAWCSLIGERD